VTFDLLYTSLIENLSRWKALLIVREQLGLLVIFITVSFTFHWELKQKSLKSYHYVRFYVVVRFKQPSFRKKLVGTISGYRVSGRSLKLYIDKYERIIKVYEWHKLTG
jgi:hypothetical protein